MSTDRLVGWSAEDVDGLAAMSWEDAWGDPPFDVAPVALDAEMALLLADEAVERLARVAVGDADAVLLPFADHVVDHVSDVVLDGGGDDEALRGSIARLQRLQDRLECEKLRRLAEADERGVYARSGRSTADGVAQALGVTFGEARQMVETAGALRRMPKTRAALARGEVTAANAREAARQLLESERLQRQAEARRRADEERRREDSADGGGGAGPAGGGGDARFGPGGADGAAGGEGGVTGDGEGGGGGDGRADVASGIDDLTAGAGRGQDRTQLRRRLQEQRAREHAELAEERARRALQRRSLWWGADTRPGHEGLGRLDGALSPELLALIGVVVDSCARKKAAGDARGLAQRRHDALVEVLRWVAASAKLPTTGGVRPHALVVTNPGALHGCPDAEPSVLDGVGPVSPETARQICCDADVTDVVVRNGEVLDVGRTRRLFTPAQRAAIIARDRVCVGCGAEAWRCQVHHIWEWDDGGPTDLVNGCLGCQGCHTNVHHFGWVVWRTTDGRYGAGRREDVPAGARVLELRRRR